MKIKLNFDIAILLSTLTIGLYLCGKFYLEKYLSFYKYSTTAIGYSFEDYLLLGGTKFVSFIIGTLLFITILSLINKVIEKNLQPVAFKAIKYIFLIIPIFLFFVLKEIVNFLKKFSIFRKILTKVNDFFIIVFVFVVAILVVLIKIPFYFLNKLLDVLKDSIADSHSKSRNIIDWNTTTDEVDIKKVYSEFSAHYLYFVFGILGLCLFAIYIIKVVEQKAVMDVKKHLTQYNYSPYYIKDEVLANVLKETPTESFRVKMNILMCNNTNCLVAIDLSHITPSQNIKLSNGRSICLPPLTVKIIANKDYVQPSIQIRF